MSHHPGELGSRGAAANPGNRALAGRSIVFLLVPICKRACMSCIGYGDA